MDMVNSFDGDTKGVSALKRLMQKYFKKLISGLVGLEKCEAMCKTSVASLSNLLEQLESLLQVDTRGEMLTCQFPDLLSRMQVKISSEIDVKVGYILDQIEVLKKQHHLAYKVKWNVLNLCKKYKADLSHSLLTTGQPTVPPLSVMFSWIDDTERLFREIYCSRQFLLENLMDKSVLNSGNLMDLWLEGVPSLINLIKDCEEQTKYFLEEKI
ncbi:hypothetical protein Bpfe_007955 [Biomphalaria pfeifferi]|uniref:Uncharacterized protein n=1 Tax=Biomphalaria pfeifferi TaxID=112525 RepID=A0AAD8FFR1_BIOPF|nr:hypothetical protein Bpfe_007955 [Biomphalaria pfeifferi]